MLATSAALKILALGPNPAVQRALQFDQIDIGGVNRATSLTQYVGGKGQGMALALQRWQPGSSIVAHFLGGDTGSWIEKELSNAGLEQVVQHVSAPTRICTTLLSGDFKARHRHWRWSYAKHEVVFALESPDIFSFIRMDWHLERF